MRRWELIGSGIAFTNHYSFANSDDAFAHIRLVEGRAGSEEHYYASLDFQAINFYDGDLRKYPRALDLED